VLCCAVVHTVLCCCAVTSCVFAGEILHCLKSFAGGVHQRDSLMELAFKGIGGLPGAKVAKLQAAEATKVGQASCSPGTDRWFVTLPNQRVFWTGMHEWGETPGCAVTNISNLGVLKNCGLCHS
jgi:hypothetical protein